MPSRPVYRFLRILSNNPLYGTRQGVPRSHALDENVDFARGLGLIACLAVPRSQGEPWTDRVRRPAGGRRHAVAVLLGCIRLVGGLAVTRVGGPSAVSVAARESSTNSCLYWHSEQTTDKCAEHGHFVRSWKAVADGQKAVSLVNP